MKKITALLLAFILMALTACSGNTLASTTPAGLAQATSAGSATSAPAATATVVVTPIVVEYDPEDLVVNDSDATTIQLNGDAIAFTGSGVAVDGSRATITAGGTYRISGVLDNGQIIVNTGDKEKVTLILDGATLTCADNAPIYVVQADKVVITLADGSTNVVSDGATYNAEAVAADEPDAAIFSKADLTLNGGGALVVNATYNHGIVSKDDLKITGGTITVNAVNDGVKGRDSVAVKDGALTINAGGDGLQANNDEDAEKGVIAIEGGVLVITAGQDAVQAETQLQVSGGELTLTTGGGSANAPQRGGWDNRGMGTTTTTDAASAKGLKAGVDVSITGGVIAIDAYDDAIHSNGSLTLGGGELTLASGDDGLHADATLTVNDGTLSITKSYEGLESAVITINGGTIHLVASDDGLNGAGGVDSSGLNGWGGREQFAESGNAHLYLNGGYLYVDAGGDGLDSNGAMDMTGGTVIVNGPTDNGNGPLDYLGAFNVTGGFLVAVGSAGMAQAPSDTSTQYSALVTFPAAQPAGTLVHIEAADGADVLTFLPTKSYQSVLICAPALQNGVTYTVYTGGSASGAATDGLYSADDYTGGTQASNFTISSMVTGGGFGGGFPGGGMRPGGNMTRPGGGGWRP